VHHQGPVFGLAFSPDGSVWPPSVTTRPPNCGTLLRAARYSR
jgi:hypothetical protein